MPPLRSTDRLPEPPREVAAGVNDVTLRTALGRFATGVAFVTAEVDGVPLGLIVNSFTSVSLRPPLVSFCPARRSLTWRRLRAAPSFAVNVLGARHAAFARQAAEPGTDRFVGARADRGLGGAPVLRDAIAVIECVTEAEHAAGDHWIVVGRVHALRMSGGDPLVYFADRFGAFLPTEQETS
jgi:flavin reductase (DIM6/NTAB) family NADH-FMN oxidoreductase RutF